jgi:hypothetical protein
MTSSGSALPQLVIPPGGLPALLPALMNAVVNQLKNNETARLAAAMVSETFGVEWWC